jgi:hypothetical protein
MEGQTVASIAASAGQPGSARTAAEAARRRKEAAAKAEQLEITVTFLIPIKPEDTHLGDIADAFIMSLPGDFLVSGNSYGVPKQVYFIVSKLHRIGKKLEAKLTYLRPGSPRR